MRENNENSIYAKDWFGKGNEDLKTAEILIKGKGPLSAIGFHIQQALEKYLKGFLIHQGWKLRRIHSLEILLNEAIDHNPGWSQFVKTCQKAARFYTGERYPLFPHVDATEDELKQLFAESETFIAEIKKQIPPDTRS